MKKIIFTILASILLVFPAMAAKKKTKVIVPARQVAIAPQPVRPDLAVPLIAVPPLLVLYDFNRRFNCLVPPDPAGLGGPGFDGKPTPPTNVMIPCYERRFLASQSPPR